MKILRISPHKPMTLIWWSKNRDMIDFNPPYQRRGRLWSPTDKAYLIDTIINGYDVPKLYLADFQFGQSDLNVSRLPYAIIDGKQRMEAVYDFFDNKLTLASDFQYRKLPHLKLGGLSLKDLKRLHPTIADEFENASLDIMSVFAEDEKDIHDIFVRLNRSKPLTGAEVRNAIVGPVPEIIRTLASHSFFLENIKFGVKRAGDLNAAAKVLLFEYFEGPMATKKSNLDEFAESKDIQKDKLELASRRVIDTLDSMVEIFIPKDPLLASAGIIPVYYWLVKNLASSYHPMVREFLIYFENMRAQNREMQKNPSDDAIDATLSRFDTLNRSTNDSQSHIGRYEILMNSFQNWIPNRNFYYRTLDLI